MSFTSFTLLVLFPIPYRMSKWVAVWSWAAPGLAHKKSVWLCFSNSMEPSCFWFWLYSNLKNCTFKSIMSSSPTDLVLAHRIIREGLHRGFKKGNDTLGCGAVSMDIQKKKQKSHYSFRLNAAVVPRHFKGGLDNRRDSRHLFQPTSLWAYGPGLHSSKPQSIFLIPLLSQLCSWVEPETSIYVFQDISAWVWVDSSIPQASSICKGYSRQSVPHEHQCLNYSLTVPKYKESYIKKIINLIVLMKSCVDLKLSIRLSGFQNRENKGNSKPFSFFHQTNTLVLRSAKPSQLWQFIEFIYLVTCLNC